MPRTIVSRILRSAGRSPASTSRPISVDLVFHAAFGVVEPPGRTKLDLAGHGAGLERAHHRGEQVEVARVESVEHGARQVVVAVERVEKTDQAIALREVGHGVEAGVGSDLGEHARVGVAQHVEVQLHGPVFLRVPLADVTHDQTGEAVVVFVRSGVAVARGGENAFGLAGAAGVRVGVRRTVVGQARAGGVELVVAPGQRSGRRPAGLCRAGKSARRRS